jgi:phosphoglycolate phosphatase
MPNRFDLIVFDWDGTLMDSTEVIATSIQRACADLGLAIPSLEQASHVIGLGLADALQHAAPDLTAERIPEMVERYRFHYLSRDAHLVLFPQVVDMLRELRGRGKRLAVATGKTRIGLDRSMAQTGLTHHFDATRTADESHPKPDPQMLYDLTSMLCVDLGKTLMVGDTTHDLLMARQAGAHGVAMTHGAHDRAVLDGFGPDAMVDSIPQLRDWLEANA